MYLLTKLKQSWSMRMSKLLELKFTPKEVAQLIAYADIIKKTNIASLSEISHAVDVYSTMFRTLYNKTDRSTAISLMEVELGIKAQTCLRSEQLCPVQILYALPDRAGRYIRADYIINNNCEYELSSDGKTLVRAEKLYGDKNILSYSTNPLSYLDFKCLKGERLVNNDKEDPECDAEYNGNSPLFLGIELEVERKKTTPKNIEHMVAADLGMDYMILKSDGSLTDGFEIVTAPATLGYHLQAWDKFFDNSAKHVTSWSNGRCGMHVHMSRKHFTPMHLGKLLTFYNNHENRDFITTIAGRNSSYAKFSEDKAFQVKAKLISTLDELFKLLSFSKKEDKEAIEKSIKMIKQKLANTHSGHSDSSGLIKNITSGGERFSAVNLTKAGTVEIRIFRGNVSKVGMLKNIEFVAAVVDFAREANFRTKPLTKEEIAERKLKRKENTDYSLHYTFFLDWLERDTSGNYNNLKKWLSVNDYGDKFPKKKVSSKTPIDKQMTDEAIREVA